MPFGFARANVFLLMRRERGRIKSGDDWKAARRGESLGFASLGVFTAAELWPIAGRAEAIATASVLAGLVVVAVWRPTAPSTDTQPGASGARALLAVAIGLVGAPSWVLWPDRLPSGVGVALVGAGAATVAGYLLAPGCRPLRKALEAGRRGTSPEIANAAALLLVLAGTGGLAAWAVTTFEIRLLVVVGLCALVAAAVVDVIAHRVQSRRTVS